MTKRVQAINPIYGMRISTGYDPLPKGYDATSLVKAINAISDCRHDYDLLMEAAQFEEVDSFYNPGTEEVSYAFVLEAIVVDKFSKTERRMAAVVRVLNKHLAGSEINALEAIIGKPRKTGVYAYVTVQLPFSDGQVVSVVFHAPEGDKRKIGPSDQIIAFQWFLNKRDITQVVAPEDGSEISLESLAMRITQLVVKNSARFERTQKEVQAERQELSKLKEEFEDASERQEKLLETMSHAAKDAESIEAKLSNTLALLEKQKSINAELTAKLNAIKKSPGAYSAKLVNNMGTDFDNATSELSGIDPVNGKYLQDKKDLITNLYERAINAGKAPVTLDEFLNPLNGTKYMAMPVKVLEETLFQYEIDLKDAKRGKKSALRGRSKEAAIRLYENAVEEYKWHIATKGKWHSETLINYEKYLTELLEDDSNGNEPKQALPVVAEVKSGIIKKTDTQTAIEAAQNWIEKHINGPIQTKAGEVIVDKKGIKDSLRHAMYQSKLDAIQALEQVLKQGEYLGAIADKDGKPIDNHYFAAKVRIGDEDKIVFARTRKADGNPNRFYVHEVFTEDEIKEKGLDMVSNTPLDGQFKSPFDFYKTIIANYLKIRDEFSQGSGSNTPLSQTGDDGQNPPSNPDGKNVNFTPAFVNDLNDIIAGKYDKDTDRIDILLDQAANQAEKDGTFTQYEDLFNRAADRLTELFKKKQEAA